ncbi:MAG: hypothetical protein ACRD07_00690 [Acidimicrobiales bacterium]
MTRDDPLDGVDASASGLDIVAVLCRMQLQARRLGCRIRVLEASDELLALIRFVGLDGVLLDEAGGEVADGEAAGADEAAGRGDDTV